MLRRCARLRASILTLLMLPTLGARAHSGAVVTRYATLQKPAARYSPAGRPPAEEFAYEWDNEAGIV
ncbi:MAG TPA: hypothetical protein VFJ58_24785 [Armatimonadota bacterium]|nr:hypothetical protein [Armatimonadota bacterium]